MARNNRQATYAPISDSGSLGAMEFGLRPGAPPPAGWAVGPARSVPGQSAQAVPGTAVGAVRGRHRRWPELQWLLLVRFLGFPVWDTLILPIVELSEVRQLRPIDIVRISPRDGWPGRLPPKELKGAAVHHFGAFFDRPDREHDFLWGRLDGAEQLLNLVAPDLDERWCRAAFQAVLEEEGPQLPAIQPVIQEIRDRLSSEGPAAFQCASDLG